VVRIRLRDIPSGGGGAESRAVHDGGVPASGAASGEFTAGKADAALVRIAADAGVARRFGRIHARVSRGCSVKKTHFLHQRFDKAPCQGYLNLYTIETDGRIIMRDEKIIRYEKPEFGKYAFYGIDGVLTGDSPITPGGDIEEECDSGFDE
jgi:hypothetical protein